MTFNSMESLNYTKGKLSERKPLTDAEGNKLPSVMILKGEKSFPVFLTTFTVINKETKEKSNMMTTSSSPMKNRKNTMYTRNCRYIMYSMWTRAT